MRRFLRKPKTTEPATPTESSAPGRPHVGQGHGPNFTLNLQRTLGNQAVLRLLRTNAAVTGTASAPSGGAGRVIGHEPARVAQQESRFRQPTTLMREPDGTAGATKPPVPKPGHTPFNFISESPALENWKTAVRDMLGRHFKMKFGTFEEAQEHFRAHLRGLPSDADREDFADRMRDRARKAFFRKEARNPSYAYDPEQSKRLKKGSAPDTGLQLEHLEDVKSKQRGERFIVGRPDLALDPDNIYVTEGGPRGTAPVGTKHAEKYRVIEAAEKTSREIRERAALAAGGQEQTGTKAAPPERPPQVKAPAPAVEPAAPKSPAVEPMTPKGPAVEPAAPKAPAVPPTPVEASPTAVPTAKPAPESAPAPAPAPVAERPPSPAAAPPARPTSAWKAGLKAGGKALAGALIFAGLDYLVRQRLEKDLEESIDTARHGAMPWAQRVKRDDPSKPVYMRLKIQSEDYSRYVPALGWMPEAPVLHMIQMALVREELDQPLVEVQDNRLDALRPGVTTTVTYTELMVP